ncbi:MAG: glycoside hydrolase family 30 beta sandwich domain-containing protein [Thomasclavelia sp.]
MKKLLRATVAVFMTLAAVMPVSAVNDSVLLEDGVEVTMSSSEMDPASANLATGKDGTARSWEDANNLELIENTNTRKDAIDLVSKTSDDIQISIDDDKEYQTFDGMGASIDESTIYNLSKMSEDKQREIIKFLIDPADGLGYSKFRLTLGSSDFQHEGEEYYTYYDVKDVNNYMNKPETLDWYNETGKGFSIQKDIDLGIIKTINTIQEIALELGVNDITFFSSCWSLPGWMKVPYNGVDNAYKTLKDSASVNETLRNTNCYGIVNGIFKYGIVEEISNVDGNNHVVATYDWGSEYVEYAAKYYVRYLEEYAKKGITIKTISLQNEMGAGKTSWIPGCNMSSEAFAAISKRTKELALESTVLNDEQKNVEIWCLEWDVTDETVSNSYGISKVDDLVDQSQGSIDGIAIHDYNSQSTSQLLNDYTKLQQVLGNDVELALTERSLWGTYGMNRIVAYLRSGCTSYNSWVIMLDNNSNSNQYNGTQTLYVWLEEYGIWYEVDWQCKADPTLLIQNADNPDEYKITPEAYMTGQFTKYIRPGYVRVDSTDTIGTNDFGISNVVFKDPDTGKLVMVVVNNSNEDQTFTAACDDYQFSATVPACNVATYQWNPNDIDVSAPEISGNDATIYVGDTTDLKTILNLKVTDDKDGEISEYTINDNGYNCQKAGKYVIEVSASDKAGNEAKASFTVTVKEKEAVVENTENKGDSTNKPTKQETTNSSNAVKTGDESQLEIYGAVVLGLAVIGGLYVTRKKLIKK